MREKQNVQEEADSNNNTKRVIVLAETPTKNQTNHPARAGKFP